MADLDFSDILVDPDLVDTFTVVSRVETVDAYGEASTTDTTTPGVIGVVKPAKPADLQILPESQRMGRHITIVTKHRLQGPSSGKQPDEIQWGGDTFLVKEILPYTHFGAGFVKAIAGSIDSLDQPTSST